MSRETIDLKPIPMLDLDSEVEELWQELNEAFQRVLRSGAFINGPEVEALEAEVARYLGVKYAVGLNSGTDALIIGLEALGIGPGDEVITTPFSFFATAEAIIRVGATPVFADIDESTLNLDPALIEPLINARTRAIMPVHLFGLPASMDEIGKIARRHGLRVIEDAAQAFGARYQGTRAGASSRVKRVGSLGDAAAFSFYPTKTLGAYGDAGVLTTDDADIAEQARRLRNHGTRLDEKYIHDQLGHNSRLDALQAAILRLKLPRVDEWAKRRREIAQTYISLLQGNDAILLPPLDDEHVFHQFTVRLPAERLETVRQGLTNDEISTQRFYPMPLSEQPALLKVVDPAATPVASEVSRQVLSLPIHPYLSRSEVERVASSLVAHLDG